MAPRLPQDDPNPTARANALRAQRADYVWDHEVVEPLAMLERVPGRDRSTRNFRWLMTFAPVAARVAANRLANGFVERRAVTADEGLEATATPPAERLNDLVTTLQGAEAGAVGALEGAEEGLESSSSTTPWFLQQLEDELEALVERELANIYGGLHRGHLGPQDGLESASTPVLDDYKGLFQSIALPEIASHFQDDATFAWLRVAGPNPLMLRRLTAPDPRLPLTEERYRQVLPDDTLASAIADKRAYLADYKALASVEDGSYPAGHKYSSAPLALFVVPPGKRSLRPVAIQCGQVPGPNTPIFTPPAVDASPAAQLEWLLAKSTVQTADGNYHEAVSHLARTHLFLEPFAIATPRQLAANHPVYLLLTVHFVGTLYINFQAATKLIAEKGGVDELLNGTIASSRALAVNGLKDYPFNDAMLPKLLAARGLDDATGLPDHPFREDALDVWKATRAWVAAYLRTYYGSDGDVARDVELQAWAQELVSTSGGRVVGFGEPTGTGAIKTIDYLTDALTLLIFTGSAMHAAVNFAQKDVMSFAPAMPLAAYAPPPAPGRSGTFEAQLPPIDMALAQLNLGQLLGGVYYSRLGHYEPGHFGDARLDAPLTRFLDQLKSIEQRINARNGPQNPRPYVHLLPSKIPQSINI